MVGGETLLAAAVLAVFLERADEQRPLVLGQVGDAIGGIDFVEKLRLAAIMIE